MDAVAKEQWALAVLTVRFDCAQQKFFQAEYGRHRRSPAVALALCLTLGAFGAHEFYLGHTTRGALRMLFCWTLVPLLLALVEAPRITRRVHADNARMARLLAEITDETFAAARMQSYSDAQLPAARTLAPEAPVRWRPPAPPTAPLAEERTAETTLDLSIFIPVTAPLPPEPLDSEPRTSPAMATPTELPSSVGESVTTPPCPAGASRRDWARHSASLDALLSGAAAEERAEPRPVAPIRDPLATSGVLLPGQSASPPRDYAKMMATDEPQAAIMGAEPASGADSSVVPAPRIQRIIVRKVALLGDQRIAEARATREVVLDGSESEVEALIEAATADARAEAMRLLATLVEPETLALASGG
ncbi:MAG TPA: TM2 domain-containing protein [Ktedonobacterales bacterium]|nr:TM2 domain-containing protein [Ktedonobacterales bacterium]